MAGHDIEDNFYAARITIFAVAFAVTLLLHSKQRRICITFFYGRSEIRKQYLSRLIDGNDTTSINVVRINKPTFFNLCLIMR